MDPLSNQTQAIVLQQSANSLSWLRIFTTPLLVTYLLRAREYRSKTFSVGLGALFLTDKADGWLAKHARKRAQKPLQSKGGRLDELSDKALHHGLQIGIASHELRRGNRRLSYWLLSNQIIAVVRDMVVTRMRNQATTHVNTDAASLGKHKTVYYGIATVLLCSPFARRHAKNQRLNNGERAAVALLTCGTILSVVSALNYRRQYTRSQSNTN